MGLTLSRDIASKVQAKVEDWLEACVKLVWVVYPERRTVVVYRSLADVHVLREGDTLTGEPLRCLGSGALCGSYSRNGRRGTAVLPPSLLYYTRGTIYRAPTFAAHVRTLGRYPLRCLPDLSRAPTRVLPSVAT